MLKTVVSVGGVQVRFSDVTPDLALACLRPERSFGTGTAKPTVWRPHVEALAEHGSGMAGQLNPPLEEYIYHGQTFG